MNRSQRRQQRNIARKKQLVAMVLQGRIIELTPAQRRKVQREITKGILKELKGTATTQE